MASKKQGGTANCLIKIENALSAYEVSAVKDQILKGFNENDGVTIDIEKITSCDTLGIQLLCAAAKTAKRQNKTFAITGESESYRQLAQNIGLDLEQHLNI